MRRCQQNPVYAWFLGPPRTIPPPSISTTIRGSQKTLRSQATAGRPCSFVQLKTQWTTRVDSRHPGQSLVKRAKESPTTGGRDISFSLRSPRHYAARATNDYTFKQTSSDVYGRPPLRDPKVSTRSRTEHLQSGATHMGYHLRWRIYASTRA